MEDIQETAKECLKKVNYIYKRLQSLNQLQPHCTIGWNIFVLSLRNTLIFHRLSLDISHGMGWFMSESNQFLISLYLMWVILLISVYVRTADWYGTGAHEYSSLAIDAWWLSKPESTINAGIIGEDLARLHMDQTNCKIYYNNLTFLVTILCFF